MAADDIIIPPLDAYQTAKPTEPTWTVQGGDPLGGPLLLIWATFARIQAGVITPGAVDNIFERIRKAAVDNPPESDKEKKDLLLRATQTEFVSFDMDDYRAGRIDADDEPKVAAENSADAASQLDLHDRRVRAAQRLNNARSEVYDIRDHFAEDGFFTIEDTDLCDKIISLLEALHTRLEPRRLINDR